MRNKIISRDRKVFKGQLEVIIVLGIVIVGILVVVLSSQQSSISPVPAIPEDIQAEQELVRDFVITALKSEATDLLKTMEAHGGYLKIPDSTTKTVFLFQDVPVWQACGLHDTLVPPLPGIENLFAQNLTNFIKNGNATKNTTFSGKNVTFYTNLLDVRVTILDNEIDFDVDIPTEVGNFRIQEPYNFRIPSLFGRIYKFAKDFANESANKRFLEVFAITSLANYGDARDHRLISDTLTACGDYFSMLGTDVDTALKSSVIDGKFIHLWEDVHTMNDWPTIYGVPNVSGKVYDEFNGSVSFYMKDDFDVSGNPDIFIPNNVPTVIPPAIPGLPAPPPTCGPVDYFNAFEIGPWPVIIRVRDPFGAYFNFASLAHITTTTVDVGTAQDFINNALNDVGNCGFADLNKVININDLNNPIPVDPPANLRFFDSDDNVCFYDADLSLDITPGDIMWFSPAGACAAGFDITRGDTLILGSLGMGPAGVQVIGSGLNVKYDDSNPADSDYQVIAEGVYIDVGAVVTSQCQGSLTNIQNSIDNPATETNIDQAINTIKKMVPGNCGLGP